MSDTPHPPSGPTGPSEGGDPRPDPPVDYPSSAPSPEALGQAPPPPSPADAAPPPPSTGDAISQTGTAWYNGPLPIAGLVQTESVGAAIGRTAVKAITAVVIFGAGMLIIPFFLFAMLAAFGAAVGGGVEEAGIPTALVAGEADADVKLVAVSVNGLILGEDRGAGGGGLFSPANVTYGYTVKEQLEELAEDDSIDGIILEVDSPGGTIFGSRAIADGVTAYREQTGKPVIAYVSGISASGGVYAMSGADQIYADYGTLVGSIGVIFGPFTTYNGVTAIDGGILGGGVTTEGGIEVEFLSAGRSKDFGNPYRPMTDEERSVLQEGLDDAYADFVTHVSDGRGIPADAIEQDLGALIFGEQQAVDNGLIDAVVNRDDSYQRAAEAAGLQEGETWKVERVDAGSSSLLDLFAGGFDGLPGVAGSDAGHAGPTLGVEPLCLGSGAMLAYHGDPAQLCTGG